MFNHVYPAWHKPAQRGFFIVAAILCITLPAIYGSSRRPRKISAKAMGAIFAAFFILWAIFTLVVRFLVPSPTMESSLPRYNPSPYPEPVTLHAPQANAVPSIPAIRLKAPTVIDSETTKRARFGDEDVSELSPPIRQNNVKFQTSPHDSTSSVNAYPTYADYRQSQHGNFDALAQRFKRAFLTSQQQKQEEELKQQQENERQLKMDDSNTDLKSLEPTPSTTTTERETNNGRRLSTSASNMLSDFAGKIRGSSIFGRSQTVLPQGSSTERQLDDYSRNSIEQSSSNANLSEIPAVALHSNSPTQQEIRDNEVGDIAKLIPLSNIVSKDKKK